MTHDDLEEARSIIRSVEIGGLMWIIFILVLIFLGGCADGEFECRVCAICAVRRCHGGQIW